MLEIALAMSLAQESDNEVKKESTSIQSQQFEEIKMLEKAIAMSLDQEDEEEAGPKQVISILVSREKLISLCLSHRMTGRFWGNLKRKWNRFD